MTVKQQAADFIADYYKKLTKLTDRVTETSDRLEEIQLEIRFIQEKEIPEAVQRRVFTGDKTQEKKVRKSLEKLQEEQQEKSEDLVVLQNIIVNFKLQEVDDMQPLFRLFQEEKNMAAKEVHERLIDAKKAYKDTLFKETESLHVYRRIETNLRQLEMAAGRRYVDTDFPIPDFKLTELAVEYREMAVTVKRL